LEKCVPYTKSRFGYSNFEYWRLFLVPDGARVLGEHLASSWASMHGAPEVDPEGRNVAKMVWCAENDGMRKLLEETAVERVCKAGKWTVERFRKEL